MKCIKDFEHLYSITDCGKVYSHITNKFLKPHLNVGTGYFKVNLYKVGKQYTYPIHRLVALAYISPEQGKTWVNHKDGDKVNNSKENLEWCTAKENSTHAEQLGLVSYKTNSYSFSLATKVLQYLVDGWRRCDVAEALGLDRCAVNTIADAPSYYLEREHTGFDGTTKVGSKGISTFKVLEVCELLKANPTMANKKISDIVGCSSQTVWRIRNKKSYTTLTKNYTF